MMPGVLETPRYPLSLPRTFVRGTNRALSGTLAGTLECTMLTRHGRSVVLCLGASLMEKRKPGAFLCVCEL